MGSGGIGWVGVGLAEVMLLIAAIAWMVMIAAGLWALVTLHRLRRAVERIEQLLRAK